MAAIFELWLSVSALLLGTLVCCKQLEDDVLDSVLTNYETLHIHHLTHTVTSHPHTRRIQFSSLGRYFELRLVPSQRFSSRFAAYSHDANGNVQPFHVSKKEFYEGHVHGEDESRVTAHVSSSDVLSAHIRIQNETYHIEPSSHYLTRPHSFHMIAYRGSEVRDRLGAGRLDFITAPSPPGTDLYLEQPETQSIFKFDSDRLKRQSFPGRIRDNSCPVFLVADYTMFNLLRNRESVASRMIQLVLAVDADIYRRTDWIVSPDDSSVNGIGLSIGGVMIHETPNATEYGYNTADPLDAGGLLERMRFNDWSRYCLTHLFVDRVFASGLLGLANIASPSLSQTGGICSTRFGDSALGGTPVIYNTGLTTLRNGGQLMIMSELVRVTGHEIGHNWGSHHDTTCGPGWLMNAYSQDGSQPSHSQFSECSRRSVGEVLLSKGFCFEPLSAQESQCGNYRVEEGEDCDVGVETNDTCCTSECEFRVNVNCSDFNSECCLNCQFANTSIVCREEREVTPDCVLDTFCNGESVTCPESPKAPDGSPCTNGVCMENGTCEPLCKANETCSCSGESECLLCCMDGEDCLPVNGTLYLPNGSPCSAGACLEGNCTQRGQDEISRIWQIIVTLNVDALRVLVSENIVGFVLIFTLLCWCPLSCLIHYCYDQPLWKRFISIDEADWSLWYGERIAAFRDLESKSTAAVVHVPDIEKQPLLEAVEEEEEERPRSTSPVDSLPPPY